jgi:hypothetical protein
VDEHRIINTLVAQAHRASQAQVLTQLLAAVPVQAAR